MAATQEIPALPARLLGLTSLEYSSRFQWTCNFEAILPAIDKYRIAACKAAGSLEPVWEEIGFRMRVTSWPGLETNPVEDLTETAISNLLYDAASGLSTRHIAEDIALSVLVTRSRLIKLNERGLVLENWKGPDESQKNVSSPKNRR